MTHCWEKRLTSVSSTFAWTRRERDSSLRDAAEAWTLPAENKISNQYSNLHLKKLEGKEKTYPEQAEGWIQKEQTSVKVKTEKQRKMKETQHWFCDKADWTVNLSKPGRERKKQRTQSHSIGNERLPLRIVQTSKDGAACTTAHTGPRQVIWNAPILQSSPVLPR